MISVNINSHLFDIFYLLVYLFSFKLVFIHSLLVRGSILANRTSPLSAEYILLFRFIKDSQNNFAFLKIRYIFLWSIDL